MTVINNVSYNNNDFALKAEYAPRLKVINNTFWGSSFATPSARGLVLSGDVTDATVLNNIVSVMSVSPGTSFKARGNNLIGVLGNNITGTGYMTLFAGEVIVGTSWGSSNFVSLSTGDLHLKSTATAAINQGKNNGNTVQRDVDGNGVIDGTLATVAGVPLLDFDDDPIDPIGGQKDIGAFEYDGP
ncbi:MAG: hypothetical protein H0T51_20745 [Pirellulales bacterium]|nr:hypothetical protein [Pirellulales bacterium]